MLAYSYLRPVVVFNVVSLPEAVQEGETGYLVGAKIPDALTAAIVSHLVEMTGRLWRAPFPAS